MPAHGVVEAVDVSGDGIVGLGVGREVLAARLRFKFRNRAMTRSSLKGRSRPSTPTVMEVMVSAPMGGSGRAAARGIIQLKGIGSTPLVDPSSPFDHRHGALYLEDAIREATWGEINHEEAHAISSRMTKASLVLDVDRPRELARTALAAE